ncbi:MAG: hypothetical protein VYA30_14935 [Myxococcota bacterium]|nr:hypothetical protein [Myxococcota bacterium]
MKIPVKSECHRLKQCSGLMTSALLLTVLTSIGCQTGAEAVLVEDWTSQMSVESVEPRVILPRSNLTLRGRGFVSRILGTSRLRFLGTTTTNEPNVYPVDFSALVRVDDSEQITFELTPDLFSQLCPAGIGQFNGTIRLEVASIQSNEVYSTALNNALLYCGLELVPRLETIESGRYAVNSEVGVTASNLLLGDSEGRTTIRVDGCFLASNQQPPCNINGRMINGFETNVDVVTPARRENAVMTLTPAIVGVLPGQLTARVQLFNYHSNGQSRGSSIVEWSVDLTPSLLSYVEPEGSSLGGFIDFYGSGFVGGEAGELTEITVNGVFEPTGNSPPKALRLNLVGEFQSSGLVRYVLNEDDELGQLLDLRRESGRVVGTFGGQVAFGQESAPFDPIDAYFQIQPIRQIVYVKYTQGFLDALSRFGLRVMDSEIRRQILLRASQIYGGLGVEFRESKPDDYRLFAEVEMTGVDPNGIGLIGYDNTPGKDSGNLRLNDQIGGVHALTQQDGYPGYGGVFVESFLSFSKRPPRGLEPNPGATELFDQIFAPFRPDLGGQPILQNERENFASIGNGDGCPASRSDRRGLISCAVFALGNMLGGTMAHEVAHSLGLADPGGMKFHNDTDMPNHLMDSGFDRPFEERAAVNGAGQEYFCRENFDYLYDILPVNDPDPLPSRTSCY